MDTQILQDPHLNLDHRVDAFEEARRLNLRVDLANFLPPRNHPRFLTALAELIRVEMDQDWSGGQPRPLSEYLLRFPELSSDTLLLREVAFEEYRLRRQAGQEARPEEYSAHFGVDVSDWPSLPLLEKDGGQVDADSSNFPRTNHSDEASVLRGAGVNVRAALRGNGPTPDSWVASVSNDPADRELLRQLERERPQSAERWAGAISSLPEAGCKFLGFHLLEELGRGAFGRVFLAQQADLANRLVALKVAADIFEESQTLAQLQHTNIVPIFSFHHVGRLQAVCMPYCGSTTLGHVLNHIQSLAGLPTSGRGLLTTLQGRKSATREAGSSRGSEPPRSRPSASRPEPSGVVEVEVDLPAPPADNRPPSQNWKLLEGMSFTDAVLWLGIQIVDGLAHAHERGVLHRDIKPANILLTDDGTPMLLDFNLATSSELRGDATAARIGGTLPYMAPEHMKAFQGAHTQPDERSDLYSVGVILFNLLTGRHPFPAYKGPVHETVRLMLQDRLKTAPSLRQWNRCVSPALEAIVRRLLAADPAKRYQKARDLKEDLERQLAHLPLKHTPEPSLRERTNKFARRHPYLTSTGSVCALALAVVIGIGAAAFTVRERVRSLGARTEFGDHTNVMRTIQAHVDERNQSPERIARGLELCERELARYGIASKDESAVWSRGVKVRYLNDAQRLHLREDVGELFFLMAKLGVMQAERAKEKADQDMYLAKAEHWNHLADAYGQDRIPRAVLEQRAGLLQKKGQRDEANRLHKMLADITPVSPRDHYLVGHWLVKEGQYLKALPHLYRATLDDPAMFSAWFVRGNAHNALGHHLRAVECYTACIALRPDSAPAWFTRGRSYVAAHLNMEARDDLDKAIELDPEFAEAYVERANVRLALDQPREALADLDRVVQKPDCRTRAYLLRAGVRAKLGDGKAAEQDYQLALKEEPRDGASFFARAMALKDRDPKGALADVDQALRFDPSSPDALQLKAHILSVGLKDDAKSMKVLDRLVQLNPDLASAIAGRGVLLARQGKRAEAHQAAEDALARDTQSPNIYQVAGIYALTSIDEPNDRERALQLLAQALRSGFGLDLVAIDSDLDPIRELPKFKEIVAAARDLEKAGKLQHAAPR